MSWRDLLGWPARAACAGTLLAGCLAVRTPEPGQPVRLEADEGIVFGRVRVFELGRELDPWKLELSEILVEDPVLRLALFQVDSGKKRPDVPVAAEGRFEWILAPGTYLLYHTPSIDPPCNEPLAAFQVAGGSDPLDLGELLLTVSVDRPLSSELASYSVSEVAARAGDDRTAEWFVRRHPGTTSVRRGTFVVDAELGGLFGNYSRKACERILARHGVFLDRPEPEAVRHINM